MGGSDNRAAHENESKRDRDTDKPSASGGDSVAEPAAAGSETAAAAGMAPADDAPRPRKGGWGPFKNSHGGKKAAPKEDGDIAALQDRLVRLQADFENYRKRTLREKNELYRNANEDMILELLPVLDHMELALEAAGKHEADPVFLQGFSLVADQLRSALRKFGVAPIEAENREFDPNQHEAISHMPSDTVADGHVTVVARKGYLLGDRVLRAAQVVVSSGSAAQAADKDDAATSTPNGRN